MAKSLEVPEFYRAPGISSLKIIRSERDPKRKNLQPDEIYFKGVTFHVARHFGFCFGVESAIDIAYRAIRENFGRRIFLLSEMIHNPDVNRDLLENGVRFLMNTSGERLVPFGSLTPEDVVIIPAFGTTLKIVKELESLGIQVQQYDTTCPFVQKVWKRAAELGRRGYSVVIHGKAAHEETRATFSRSDVAAPTMIVRDMDDTEFLANYIRGSRSSEEFWQRFEGRTSEGFDPETDLTRIGVVNQTTMLATETHAIALTIRKALLDRYGTEQISEHYADTRDTLCYATYENQSATKELVASGADIGIVVGGYNSSNTSHLVELLEEAFPTFYIKDKHEILSNRSIRHFNFHSGEIETTENWLPKPANRDLQIAITSGASCPDALVEAVMERIAKFFDPEANLHAAINRQSALD